MKKTHYIVLVLLLFIIIACSNEQIQFKDPSNIFTPTNNSITPRVGVTRLVESKTPTLTPQNNAILHTPVPTLTKDEEKKFWLEVLSPNVNCSLPCFMGIESGKSHWTDLSKTLLPVGITINEPLDASKLYNLPIFLVDDSSNPFIQLYGNSAIIHGVYAKMILRSYASQAVLDIDLLKMSENYSVENILRHFVDPPDEILIGIPGRPYESSSSWVFETWLFYKKQNTLIHYTYENIISTNSDHSVFTVCPAFSSLNELEIFVSSDLVEKFVVNDLGNQDFRNKIVYGELLPLKDSTNMDVNDYYRKYLGQDNICFESPAAVWH